MTKIIITDWKTLIKLTWNLELWYQDNYRKLSNVKRKDMGQLLDKMTFEAQRLKNQISGDKT